jgi:hypothetical protein
VLRRRRLESRLYSGLLHVQVSLSIGAFLSVEHRVGTSQ